MATAQNDTPLSRERRLAFLNLAYDAIAEVEIDFRQVVVEFDDEDRSCTLRLVAADIVNALGQHLGLQSGFSYELADDALTSNDARNHLMAYTLVDIQEAVRAAQREYDSTS